MAAATIRSKVGFLAAYCKLNQDFMPINNLKKWGKLVR
jgi:hypothetical protein